MIIKASAMALIITLPLVLLLIHRWRVGNISLPNTGLVYSVALLPIVYLLSTIFARDKFDALLSLRFDTDSAVMITLSALAMVYVVLSFINHQGVQRLNFRTIIIWLISVISGVFVIQILWQLIFNTAPAWLQALSLVSSWVDVSILLALSVILLLTGQTLNSKISKRKKISKILIVSILMLILGIFLNTMSVLVLLALISAVQIIVIVAKSEDSIQKMALVLPGIVVVISSLFILDANLLNGRITATVQNFTKVSFVDIRPNWQGTITVAKGSLEESGLNEKLFGPGVGSFAQQWRVYKPISVNTTRFWSSNFNYAVGFIPTTVITGGIVVFAAWLLFFFMLIKLLLLARRSQFAYPVLFMWTVMFFTPVNYILLLIAFILTGALLRDAIKTNLITVTKYKLRGEGANKLILYIAIPAVIVVSIGVVSIIAHRALLNSYILRASNAMLSENFNKAEQLLSKAKMLADLDVIEQGYTRIAFTRLALLLSEAQTTKTEVNQEALQAALANLLSHARAAIEKNPTDPINYVALGNISEQLMALQIEGAKDSALAAYTQAASLDPLNPDIPFALARLSATDEDKTDFIKYLEQSLTIKPNYVPALYQYALLQLFNNNKEAAEQLLTAVVQIDNNNANALYYLALLYVDKDRIPEALVLMQRVQLLNPENEEIKKIVDTLKTKVQENTNNQSDETNETPDSPQGN